MNVTLKIPYSFVPCSNVIYTPEWSPYVSHDLPLKDSYSGAIDITLTNKNYLCVGGKSTNTKDRDKNESSKVDWAKTPNNELIIPGSSIKGMLRNDASIICFGKYSQFENKHYSHRDISSNKTDYCKKYQSYKVIAPAWLKLNDQDEYELRFCKCAKAFNDDLNKLLKLTDPANLLRNSVKNGGKNLSRKAGGKTANPSACDKYELLKKNNKGDLNTMYEASIGPLVRKTNNGIKEQAFFKNSPKYNESNKKKGYIVFTNYRIEGSKAELNKFYDYSYFYYDVDCSKDPKKVSKDIVNDFIRAQSPEVDEQIRYLFNHQNKELGVPVWVFADARGEVKELGICRMPRLLTGHSIDEMIKQTGHDSDVIFDLPELLFGTIRNGGQASNLSLKSRVSISDFISEKSVNQNDLVEESIVLAEPKTSFAKGYLVKCVDTKNPEERARVSYDDPKSCIAGWKRYKVQNKFARVDLSEATDAQKSKVNFLKSSYKFKGTILFNNLKKEELGALLYVIDFWQNKNCYHMLGHAKPYGAGAVTLKIDGLRFPSYETQSISVDEAINSFRQEMEDYFTKIDSNQKWEESLQIKNLIEISTAKTHRDHHDYKGSNDQVYNTLEEFGEIAKPKNNISFEYEISGYVPKSNDNLKHVTEIQNYIDIYKKLEDSDLKEFDRDLWSNLVASEKKKREDELKRRAAEIEKENLKANASEADIKIIDFLDQYNNDIEHLSREKSEASYLTEKENKQKLYDLFNALEPDIKSISEMSKQKLKDFLFGVVGGKKRLEYYESLPGNKDKAKLIKPIVSKFKDIKNKIFN